MRDVGLVRLVRMLGDVRQGALDAHTLVPLASEGDHGWMRQAADPEGDVRRQCRHVPR